jgi:ADP-ribose pyrophosphatase YjhB (NUDIX family)
MNMEKRESCRAIIFDKNKMVAMYREKNNRVYYAFPGGGRNEGEDFLDCVKREVLEEFGIEVKPIREVYTYENDKTYQHFYLCDWVSGELGTGQGEEFQGDVSRGVYVPMLIENSKLSQISLMPPEVASALVNDLKTFGEKLDTKVKYIEGE